MIKQILSLLLMLMIVPLYAATVRVALWEESFASSASYSVVNADPIVTMLTDGDHGYDFVATKISKAQVESGILQKNSFDVFLVGGKEHVRWSDSMASQVKNFVVTQGGGYVGMGWGVTYSLSSLSSTGYADLRSFQPTTQTNSGYNNRNGAIAFTDLSHSITSGLSNFTPNQESSCALITASSWAERTGATIVARNTSNNEILIVADDSGNGRGVYLGTNIGSYNIYADRVDDNTERLMENSLYWAAMAGTVIPEPSSSVLCLLATLTAGLFFVKKRENLIF